jgi:hypothetical protein
MKILEQRKLEDCIDGSQIFQYSFDMPWTEQRILSLKKLGRLDYFKDFPRPFFRLCGNRGLQLKGVGGGTACLIFFPRTGKEVLLEDIRTFFESEDMD